jgi:hypothetical protein
MALGVEFKIGVDGQQGIKTLDLMQQKFKSLGNTVKTEFGDKVKAAVTVAAIEESIRRTGEWAQQLERSAIALGTTTDKLQALNLLADKSNVEQGKLTGWFDTVDSKRREAIAGNYDLVQSFQALGATYQDLQHMSKSDLFGKLLSNVSLQNVVSGTPMGNAAENVLGNGSLPQFQAVQKVAGGQNLTQFTDSALANKQIVEGGDVSSMSQQWAKIKQDLEQALKALTPIGRLVLSLVEILSEALLGATRVFTELGGVIKGLFTGDLKAIQTNLKGLLGGLLTNAVFGLAKIITSVIDLVGGFFNSWIRKIPGMSKLVPDYKSGGGATGMVQSVQDSYNKKFNIEAGDVRGGEGLGNLAGVVGTGGAGAVARAGTKSLLEAAGLAEKVGAVGTSGRLLNMAIKTNRYAESNGLAGAAVRRLMLRDAGKASGDEMPFMVNRANAFARTAGILSTGIVGAIAAQNNSTTGANGQVRAGDNQYHGVPWNQAPTVFTGEGSAALKIGGTFGSGIQARLIRLNEEQISLLSQISKNTSFLNKFDGKPVENPNSQPTGGM